MKVIYIFTMLLLTLSIGCKEEEEKDETDENLKGGSCYYCVYSTSENEGLDADGNFWYPEDLCSCFQNTLDQRGVNIEEECYELSEVITDISYNPTRSCVLENNWGKCTGKNGVVEYYYKSGGDAPWLSGELIEECDNQDGVFDYL